MKRVENLKIWVKDRKMLLVEVRNISAGES